MDDTLLKMAIEIFQSHPSYKMWDKGQMVFIFSWKKCVRDTIFVGYKEETIQSLAELITIWIQWTDYIKQILTLLTVTPKNISKHSTTKEYQHNCIDSITFLTGFATLLSHRGCFSLSRMRLVCLYAQNLILRWS